MILILLVAVMALIALFSEIEGDNVRHGIMGAGISTLPLVAYCISVVRVRRGWYLVAATLNGLFFALALAMVLIAIILMDDPSMMKNLLSVLLVLLVPLTLNIFALIHIRRTDSRLMPHPDIPGAAGGKKLEGLGGWLILVGSNVVLSPFVIAAKTYKSYAEMFASGVWDVLTSPDSMAYHALWAPLAIGEIILNSALILAWIYIAFLFFSKRRAFPFWFIAIHIATVCLIVIDAIVVHHILPDAPIFDTDTLRELSRPIGAILIWAPYMLMSKRVKSTFLH
ncbi:MAG TPA: DUF2569 domain-containing protein [Nitrosomonas europaea]|uniref:DUF2569 domain-containing protein n=1 Tax=Nitrosomonas TaxID=914 RepID=UPI0024909205|nr:MULTISPECIES: DUF2569 domain-containing protein [Nitrosomonas]MEB2332501.1 DUF2569 domain-containing protein [Nitrosomonas sp.]HRN82315.1 DUF2569 domain-containing protein [Nitrosomonas europaea]HRO56462.1 DUF2569 domain-containing protein [Nitrosomonas europaea]HRQ08924.1 DUF2569 domain-containing protein [Nitrosomonas europaea]HUM74760.1 DUF2569 domain-containing protein [Nitrosomonas europaea]